MLFGILQAVSIRQRPLAANNHNNPAKVSRLRAPVSAASQDRRNQPAKPMASTPASAATTAKPAAAPLPRTLMLLGSGELGKEVAIAAQRLGCRVIAVDRDRKSVV